MQCPRCDVALREGRYHDVPIDICTRCSGILIDQRLLVRALDKLVVALESRIDLEEPVEELPDDGRILCPRCGLATENYGYMGMRQVMIDRCEPCRVLWLDANELGAMAKLHAKTNRRLDRSWERRRQDLLESGRRLGVVTTARAVSEALAGGLLASDRDRTVARLILQSLD